jgi:hypothetical protein
MTAGKFLKYFIFVMVVGNLALAAIVFIGGFASGPEKKEASATNAVGSVNIKSTNSATRTNSVL